MSRTQRSAPKNIAHYLAALMLGVTVVAWLVFLGWGAWSLIHFII